MSIGESSTNRFPHVVRSQKPHPRRIRPPELSYYEQHRLELRYGSALLEGDSSRKCWSGLGARMNSKQPQLGYSHLRAALCARPRDSLTRFFMHDANKV
jgi:hypothetical protein